MTDCIVQVETVTETMRRAALVLDQLIGTLTELQDKLTELKTATDEQPWRR